jgi:hypothetical protein
MGLTQFIMDHEVPKNQSWSRITFDHVQLAWDRGAKPGFNQCLRYCQRQLRKDGPLRG